MFEKILTIGKFYLLSAPRLFIIILPLIVFGMLLMNREFMTKLESTNNKLYGFAFFLVPAAASGFLLVYHGAKINHIAHKLGL
jgi:hypothetical protein